MNARDLLEKASRAAASAKLLSQAGDADGACNRAYYAMFDAARAALLASATDETDIPRTHSGLITAFSLKLVKTGRVPLELGKALNRAAEIRLIADYKDEPVAPEQVGWIVEQASVFVAAMRSAFLRGGNG